MKRTTWMAALLGGLARALAIPLLAQTAGQGACEKGCGLPNLTADQTAKIAKLKLEHQKAQIPLQAALKTRHLELRQLMLDKASPKSLEAKIDEIAKAQADLMKSCLSHKTAVAGILTDEQKKALGQECGGMSCGSGAGHGSAMGHGAAMCHGAAKGQDAKTCHGDKGCGDKGCGEKAGQAEKGGKAAKDCGGEGCGSKTGCKK